ncbi:hypothetical protein HPP92_017520 [Vanilla planifolia]|uniref:Uncharacterized protein n=1 Tax=Vanilla planifolia TaxID=51239 RepID=A0A835QI65_VANPL|nr:hypothetical protein HPP92_017520 [Vanilla planifolia]
MATPAKVNPSSPLVSTRVLFDPIGCSVSSTGASRTLIPPLVSTRVLFDPIGCSVKQYRGLSNPQCVHGIEVVSQPNLSVVSDADHRKWMELTGRELNFSIPLEASDYSSWRNLPSTEFELDRHSPLLKTMTPQLLQRKLPNGTGLNLLAQHSNHTAADGIDFPPASNKRRKDCLHHGLEDDFSSPNSSYSDRAHDIELHAVEPPWLNEFSGVMRQAYGPVTAAKTIYEGDEGYLIMVSLPFSDQQSEEGILEEHSNSWNC